jgi:glycolate oxidase iron-sulfur subunit
VTADRGGFAGLDACVHCGFCLQACPTFLATGDEADSPRGRIALMQGLERGEIAATDAALITHLDRCLGCRGCEPVCPSGVAYGRGLEAARERLAARRRPAPFARLALHAMTSRELSPTVYALARAVRATGLPRRLAGWGRVRFALGMLGASMPMRNGKPIRNAEWGMRNRSAGIDSAFRTPHSALLFRGCIMNGLFSHVHDATARTLAVNGIAAGEVAGQGCCGALHAHAGLVAEARALARANVAAFAGSSAPIVVNSAGCGAILKDYGHLLPEDAAAAAFAARVRDVTEVLAERGPAPGAPLGLRIAYDPPCHLLHAQRVAEPPRRVLAAIPDAAPIETPGAARCCGSAGLYGLVQPGMSHAVLGAKLEELRVAAPDVVATGNPGCQLQLGAGLAAAGLVADVRHPVELLDRSYRAAGYYA